jgi:phosphomannomutase
LRLAKGLEWVHLRKSGTEPIIRVIAEASDLDRAQALIRAAREGVS